MVKNNILQAAALFTITQTAIAYDPAFIGGNPLSQTLQAKGIYGGDDRKEYFEVHPAIQKISASVPALVQTRQLELQDGMYALKTMTHTSVFSKGSAKKLCPEDAFYGQPVASFCSGVVIDDNKIATAGHCVKKYVQGEACDDISLVFGYELTDVGKARTRFAKQDVYQCKRVLLKALQEKADYAVLEVERKMQQHPPLAISGTHKISDNESVSVIGYPRGLPMKISGGATVRENTHPEFFATDLDTFGGNSGSPIFNTIALLKGDAILEGLLVRGATDYIPDSQGKGCFITNTCTAQDAQDRRCAGESVARIDRVKQHAKMIHLRPVEQRLKVKARQDKIPYKGELKIELQIPEAGYLNIVEINPKGQYTLLFPNGFEKNNHVLPGKMTLSEAANWKLEILSGPYGKHGLVAVLSQYPLNLYQQKSDELVGKIQGFAPSSLKDLMVATRGMEAGPQPTECATTRGIRIRARCKPKPKISMTQVCYYQNANDC